MYQDKIKAGVIGWPISHSLSPRLFSYWLKKYKINGLYNAYAVEEKELPGVLSNLRKEGLAGLNVTVPHKQTVMEYVDQLSERASKFGAVNTITLK